MGLHGGTSARDLYIVLAAINGVFAAIGWLLSLAVRGPPPVQMPG
jgi:hypothetical protein